MATGPKPPPLSPGDEAKIRERIDALGRGPGKLPLAAPVEREPTLVRGFPGAPEPVPVSTTLESAPGPGRPPRIVTPPSFESPARQEAARRAVEAEGDRVEPVPESSVAPDSEPPRGRSKPAADQPWWRTAKGMAIVLPILVTSITGVLGGITAAVVVPVVKAIREPHEGAKAKDIAEAKVAGERCDAAVTSERAARLASQEAIRADAAKLDAKVSELSNQLPAVKPDPSRPPTKP